MIFKKCCVLVPWTKVASAMKGLNTNKSPVWLVVYQMYYCMCFHQFQRPTRISQMVTCPWTTWRGVAVAPKDCESQQEYSAGGPKTGTHCRYIECTEGHTPMAVWSKALAWRFAVHHQYSCSNPTRHIIVRELPVTLGQAVISGTSFLLHQLK